MLPIVLKTIAPLFIMVGGLHLFLGVRADVLLGADLSAGALSDPVLDSQNRFYAVSFTIYGVLFFLAAGDLDRYRPMLKAMLWVFFAAGLARIVSISVVGMPSLLILVLTAIELILPPVLLVWLKRSKQCHAS